MELPDLIRMREIGFIPFQGSMVRHRSLRTKEELARFVREIVPRHLYHSVAYYSKPTIRSMKDKIWKGAELIFDLDADHLEGASSMTYAEILAEVKKHTIRLINTFLLDFLGIDPSMVKVYFSGGRGYHVHVQSESIYPIDSNGRREISNLIRGEGINLDQLVSTETLGALKSGGWFSLLDGAYTSFYDAIANGSDGASLITKYISGPKAGLDYLESLRKTRVLAGSERRKIEILAQPGEAKYHSFNAQDRGIAEKILEQVLRENKCEIDEPVTTDLHRLIRFPDSLHGKTGLRVKRIPLEEMKDFDPLVSAIPEIFLDGEAKIVMKRKMNISMGGSSYDLEGEAEVPTYVGIFAVALGGADFR